MVDRTLAKRFRDLHREGLLVLPNAWDAASGAVIAAAGAVAIATTSSGVSWSLGVPDGEGLQGKDMIAMVARIVRTVAVPVSADLEEGYAKTAAGVAETVEAAMDAGAVGANLEDRLRTDQGPLRIAAEQCERLAAARAAADRSGIDFVINARTDVYLAAVGAPADREEATIARAELYRSAGADCLFVPGVADLQTISTLVRRSPLPLNILLEPGRSPSLLALREAGVRRVTVGHQIAAIAYSAARRAAEILLGGEQDGLAADLSHSDLQQLMRLAKDAASRKVGGQ